MTGEEIEVDSGIEYVIEEEVRLDQRPKIEWVDLCDYFRSEETNRFVEPVWEARRLWMSPVEFYHAAKKNGYDEDNVESLRVVASERFINCSGKFLPIFICDYQ